MTGRGRCFRCLWALALLIFLVSCARPGGAPQSEEYPGDPLPESSSDLPPVPPPAVEELPFYEAVAPEEGTLDTEILDFREGRLLFSVEEDYSRSPGGMGIAASTRRLGVYDVTSGRVLWEACLPEEKHYFYNGVLTGEGIVASGILLDEREENYRIYEFREGGEGRLLMDGTVGGRSLIWPVVVPRDRGAPLVILSDVEEPDAYLLREGGPEHCPIPVEGRFYSVAPNVRWNGKRCLTFWEIDGRGQFLCWDPEGEYSLVPLPEGRKILSYGLMEDGILACLQSQDGEHLYYSELHYLPLDGSEPFWTYSSRFYGITEAGEGRAVAKASGNPQGPHEILVSADRKEIEYRPLELPGLEGSAESVRITGGPEGGIMNFVESERVFLCSAG